MRLAYLLMMLCFVTSCSKEHRPDQPISEIAIAQPLPVELPALSAAHPGTGDPAMHAIRHNHLQQAMIRINNLVYGQMQNEVGVSREKQVQTQKIAKIAHELASDQNIIIGTLPLLNLNPSKKYTFAALADKLRVNALQMEDQANRNQIKAIPGIMEKITSTCTACHDLFRKSQSILEKCKDSKNTC